MPRTRRARISPLFTHASLMQSGFVQSRMKEPRTTRTLTEVIVRSFDDGRDPNPMPNSHGGSQYDVLASNPALNIAVYEGVSVATSTGRSAGNNGHECDVAAANPRFDQTPYEGLPGEPPVDQEHVPAATSPRAAFSTPAADTPAIPSVQLTSARKSSNNRKGTDQAAPAARTNSITTRQLDKLVTDADFRADLDEILSAASTAQPTSTAEPTARRPSPGRGEQTVHARGESRSSSGKSAPRELSDKLGEHAIFDKIAENMQFATAYDLPSISLSRRFDSFDRQGPRRTPAVRPRTLSNPTDPPAAATAPTTGTRAAPSPANENADSPDQQDVAPTASNVQPPQLPPAPPQTLRPYSQAEMVATYGDPRVDPETWAANNVITVQIPQLAGVSGVDGATADGSVAFHRLGMRSLTDLFAAWELAGLMSKVLSFDGTHEAQSPHGEGANAHVWAIAFDINAKWNPSGNEPAPMQAEGSVTELVEIANRHGFVWGGHDPRRKAGLHFELGHRI